MKREEPAVKTSMFESHSTRDGSFEMTEDERVKISTYIEKEFGIKMTEAKKPLLIGRLSKRLRAVGVNTFGAYFEYIHSPGGREEYKLFTDLVSTHETSFFREPGHYDFMLDEALPALYKSGAGRDRDLRILSAACSTGEEIYSIACVLEEFAARNKIRSLRYHLTGTDISTHAIKAAASGMYKSQSIEKIPVYAQKYFMHSKDPSKKIIRVVPEIREKAVFMEMNLLDKSYPFDEKFDIIFCRNVMIYFERKTQEDVADKLTRILYKGGYLLVGHSETLIGFSLPVVNIAPASYIKKD